MPCTQTTKSTETPERRHRPMRKRKQNHSPDMYNSEDSLDSDSMDETLSCKKPERQLMRPWLIDQVELGDIPGLIWLNDDKTMIKIPWTHASRHGWDANRDSDLFRRWAVHTGKFIQGVTNEESNPKKWKANFRCAMNSLPDVKEDKEQSHKRGHNAFKVYRLLKEKPRGCGTRKKSRCNSESSDSEQHYKKYVTKADRLESLNHKRSIKEELRKKIQGRAESNRHESECEALPPHTVSSPITIPPQHVHHHQQPYSTQYNNNNYKTQSSGYYSLDADAGRISSIPFPRTDYLNHSLDGKVEREEEVITSRKPRTSTDWEEHSYARNSSTNSSIPSMVQDYESGHSDHSDYGSSSPQSNYGQVDNNVEGMVQCISEMMDENVKYHQSTMDQQYSTSQPTSYPDIRQPPHYSGYYSCQTTAAPLLTNTDPSFFKRSESMETFSSAYMDQALSLTTMNTSQIPTPMQIPEHNESLGELMHELEFNQM